MRTRRLRVHVPLSLATKIDSLAIRLDRPLDWIVEQSLRTWIEREELHHRLTLEALVDVDAGRVIDHDIVKAWADSLDTADSLPPAY
jgi:predicted transcriptional regulator